ncbi:MAG: transcriptional repressor [Methylococcaceae bacterium]
MSHLIEFNTTHNHDACIHDALQNAQQICQEKGGVLTDIRRQVLELIWRNHHPVKAYDIIEKFKPSERTQGAAKPTTIYRALEFLLEKGLIHRVESLNAFIGCNNPLHVHELLLLICKKCENVQERSAEIVMDSVKTELINAHFIAHSKTIEIHGLCENCIQDNQVN